MIGDKHITDRDRDLLSFAQQGDERAWTQLMERHQEAVFRLAYLILGDATEAEEAAQDAFIRAFVSLGRFDVTRPFRPWIMQIARNTARNRRRSLGRYASAIRRWWQTAPVQTDPSLPGDDARLLWQAVQQLPAGAQEVIYLRYFLQMSEAEVAATLNIAPGTVKSRTHRALKHLRTIIRTDYPELVAPG